MASDWNFSNTYLLVLMSLGYIVGELAHFLINTTSRFVRDLVASCRLYYPEVCLKELEE